MTPFKQMNGNFYRAYSFVTFKVISALILPFPRPLRQYKNLPAQILHLHTTEMRCYRIPTAISAKSGYHSNQNHQKSKGTVHFPNRAYLYHFSLSGKSFVMLFAHIAIVDALCRNADVPGAIIPQKPIRSNAELNRSMKL